MGHFCHKKQVVVLIGIVFFLSKPVMAQEASVVYEPQLKSWSKYLPAFTIERIEWDRRYWDELFYAIDRIRVFDWENEELGRMKLDLEREVLQNHDQAKTWSIIDEISIPANLYLYQDNWDIGVDGIFSARLGTQFGLRMINIRRVEKREYAKTPTYKDFLSFIRRGGLKKKLDNQVETYFTDDLSDDVGPSLLGRDIRFENLINRVAFPLRIPLKAEKLNKLSDGEIMSYQLHGAISMGLGVGFDLSMIEGLEGDRDSNIGVNLTLFSRGAYEVGILKEDQRFTRVRVSKIKGKGTRLSFGASYQPEWFEGQILLEQIDEAFEITPFRIRLGKEWNEVFNLNYRFDMTNPHAAKAYEDAVLGRLKLAEELAVDKEGRWRSIDEYGVEKVDIRNEQGESVSRSNRVKLSYGLRFTGNARKTSFTTVITLPDGKVKTFESIAESDRYRKLFVKWKERADFRFHVYTNLTKYNENPKDENAFALSAWGQVMDSKTSPNEMMRYILDIEDSVSQFGLFPRPPGEYEIREGMKDNFIADEEAAPYVAAYSKRNLGRSEYSYQVLIKNSQLEKFINVDDATKWRMLEKVFGVKPGRWKNPRKRFVYILKHLDGYIYKWPAYLLGFKARRGTELSRAKKMFKRWKKIKKAGNDIQKKAELLGNLFYDDLYGFELFNLLRTTLDDEKVPYYVASYTKMNGNLALQGKTVLQDFALATQKQLEYEQENYTPVIYDARYTELRGGKILLRFKLAAPVKMLLVKLKRLNTSIFRDDFLAQLVIDNPVDFKLLKVGDNKILLDPEKKESPYYKLAKKLKLGKDYKLSLAANERGIIWNDDISLEFVLGQAAKNITPHF